MKKKVLALLITACMVAAGVPSLAMAAGSSSDEVTVTFSAGVPGAFDMVDENITAQGNLAELFFPEIAGNEPANAVSFADVLVAAHIQKYGVSKVKDNLDIGTASWDPSTTSMYKQFGHSVCGLYYVDNKALAVHVSDPVKTGQVLYAGACDGTWDLLYSYFDKDSIQTTAGKSFSIKLTADDWGAATVPTSGTIATVDKETGKMTEITAKTDKSGNAEVVMDNAGEFYLSANGKAESYGSPTSLAGALTKVTVGLDKTKITKAKAKGKKAVLKWKKVTGAKNYEIYKSNKKNGRYKKLKTVKKTSYTDKKVKKGKKYFYKVRAIAKADGKTYKGAFSKKVKVKIKK